MTSIIGFFVLIAIIVVICLLHARKQEDDSWDEFLERTDRDANKRGRPPHGYAGSRGTATHRRG